MNSILKGFMALGCLLMASSCSEISFGDKFWAISLKVPEQPPKRCFLRE